MPAPPPHKPHHKNNNRKTAILCISEHHEYKVLTIKTDHKETVPFSCESYAASSPSNSGTEYT
eukprot:3284263-Amphidinium_carterae.1